MGLPPPEWLSLAQAVSFVIDRCRCSKREAEDALQQAGRDGRLEAKGSIPLSTHPDLKKREAHPVRRYEALRDVGWNQPIDWVAGKIGFYSAVIIKRSSIESWLAPSQLPKAAHAADAHTTSQESAKNTFRADTDAEYQHRVDDFRARYDRYPTFAEDEEWRKGIGISRIRMTELRAAFLPPDVQKGGAPKKRSRT
jgi:hypothetical protein